MIIDVHSHLAYHKIFAEGFLNAIQKGIGDAILTEKLIKHLLNDRDGDKMVQQMDKAKIDKSVLLIADFGVALNRAALSIDQIHQLHFEVLKRFPDRFLVFAGVDPRRGKKGFDIFKNAIDNFGFHGLKIYPPCGFELDDPGLTDYYDFCQARGLPILTHTGPSLDTLITEKRYPATIKTIAPRYPECNFILGHGAAVNWELNMELALGYDNIFLDISTFQQTISGVEEWENRLQILFNTIPDKVLFGTDWPMFKMSVSQTQLVEMCLNAKTITDHHKSKLMHENASFALNLNKQFI